MGNSLGGGKKSVKIMKINGETFKLKTPVQAGEVVKDYPGFVLLESESVKHFGIRAKPLQPQQQLEKKRLYFLVELPNLPEPKDPRRVRSGIQMSAKDKLESLKLARRSASDLTIISQSSRIPEDDEGSSRGGGSERGGVRIKVRLSKAEVAKLMEESADEAEATKKIMELYMAANNKEKNNSGSLAGQWKSGPGRIGARERRVSFMPVQEGEILAVTT